MHADFCVEVLEEALARYGRQEIFNTNQGSQFTGTAFTGVLKEAGIKISMDGRGRWMGNVFIERLWRSIKDECVYLHAFENGSELRAGLSPVQTKPATSAHVHSPGLIIVAGTC